MPEHDAPWTQGPWFICADPPPNDHWYPGRTIGSKPEGTRICDLTPLRDKAGSDANASLIAAAPDLYEALRDLAAAVESEVNEKGGGGFILARLSDARAALAKAAREQP